MNLVRAAVTAGFLLSVLLVPQPALADAPGYSISPIPQSGFYGRTIEVRVTVDEPGTYFLCWGTTSLAYAVHKFDNILAGNTTAWFSVPEADRKTHTLWLTDDQFGELASAAFNVTPTVHYGDKKGPVGTEVKVQGYGFTANETNIPIEFRGDQVETAAANADGSWNESYVIPELAAGSYRFEVGPDSVTDEVWHIHFTVTPEISVSPTSGVAGQKMNVSGTGFASNEKAIRVVFDGETVKDNISANANGSWSAEVTVPRRASGDYLVGASGYETWAREVPEVEFTIETGVWADPPSAYVGDEITVTGSGFAAWEQDIRVTFDGRVVDTGSITADRDGSWVAYFALPTSTYGSHDISAFGARTVTAGVRKATVSTMARIHVSPIEASPGDSVSVSGDGFPGNQAVTVTFADRTVPESVQSLADGRVSTIVTVPPSSVGDLLVTATGGAAQASTDFTIIAKTLPTPQPISPEENRTLRSGEVTFEWGRIAGSNNVTVTYTLEITGPGGSRSFSGIQGLTYQIPKEEALTRGDHTWRVRATDEFGNHSLWSEPLPFSVSPVPGWSWALIGLAVFTTLMVVAYREGKFQVTDVE